MAPPRCDALAAAPLCRVSAGVVLRSRLALPRALRAEAAAPLLAAPDASRLMGLPEALLREAFVALDARGRGSLARSSIASADGERPGAGCVSGRRTERPLTGRSQRKREKKDDLHGWHDDGEEASREGPGRMHEHSSAQKRHEQHRKEKSRARRDKNETTTNTSMRFAAKMRRSTKPGAEDESVQV